MNDLSFLLLEMYSNKEIVLDELNVRFKSDASFGSHTYPEAVKELQRLALSSLFESVKGKAYSYTITEKGKEELQKEKIKRTRELERIEAEKKKEEIEYNLKLSTLDTNKSVQATNKSVLATNEQMTMNAKIQNRLTMANIIVSISAVLISMISLSHSIDDSDYVKRKDLIQELDKERVERRDLINNMIHLKATDSIIMEQLKKNK